jgi:predicted PurR-regulated permease PerM
MFFTAIIIICLLACGASLLLNKFSKSDNYENAICSWAVVAIIMAFIMFIVAGISSTIIYSSKQDIKVIDKKVEIYVEQRNALISQYRTILDTTYEKYEMNIFDKVTNSVSNSNSKNASNINISIPPQWPDTKYLSSLKELVNKIESLNSNIYALQINRQDLLSEARSYRSGIWVPAFIQPSIDD